MIVIFVHIYSNLEFHMKNNGRLMSLDALRGFDMMFIMGLSTVIAGICGNCDGAFAAWLGGQMHHVEWNGLAHHDTIFPLFLFLAGVSFPFSYAKHIERKGTRRSMYLKIFRRAAILVFLGLIYNGLLDFGSVRCCSVLARIGLAWMFGALIYMNFNKIWRAVICVAILVGYALVSRYVAAPDVPGGDPLSMDGCLVGYIDRMVTPGRLIYNDGRFDPEGLFSLLPAIVTALLGMFTGEWLKREDVSGNRKTLVLLAACAVMGVCAYFADMFVPINKMLWSSSFVLAVGAYSIGMMAVFYWIIDVRGWRGWTLPFVVVGMNSITSYMAWRIIDFHAISKFFLGGVAGLLPEQWGWILITAGAFLSCWLLLYFLHRQKIYLKV